MTEPNTARMFHMSLNTSSLERSLAFYKALLGVEPVKVRPDYAKFELSDPPLVLSLIPGTSSSAGNLNHAGIRVQTSEDLVDVQRRLEQAGIPTEREDGVECCYALQTKFWAHDPDGARWEIYVFHADVPQWGVRAPAAVPLPLVMSSSSILPGSATAQACGPARQEPARRGSESTD